MDTTIPVTRPDVVAAPSAPRPTPPPVRVQFSEVLAKSARGIVSGAEGAMNMLPGGPLMAVALRGGASGASGSGMHPLSGSMPGLGNGGGNAAMAPEGPGAAGINAGASGSGGIGGAIAGALGGGAGASGASASGGDAGVESTLAQSQDMNLYYLQIQEEVNAQNRTFSTLSNVLKAEHDTVKTAIGNIR